MKKTKEKEPPRSTVAMPVVIASRSCIHPRNPLDPLSLGGRLPSRELKAIKRDANNAVSADPASLPL
jgi:hypothetical protein